MDQQLNINPPQKIQTGALVALIMLSVFLLVKTFNEIKQNSNIGVEAGQNIISVAGKGEVFATADIANFTFSIDQEGVTVAEAQRKATEISDKAVKILKDAGVEDKDIKTISYNVGPKYEYNTRPCTAYSCPPSNPTIVGYQVNETLFVKVREIDKAGGMISDLGEIGVTNISSLEFTVDDEDTLKTEARTIAITDAKEKAKKLAKDLGVRIGGVVSFNETSEPYPIYYNKAMDAVGVGAPQIAPEVNLQKGENKITVNVNVTYRIK